MVMMTKKRTSPFASAKLLIVIPVIGIVFLAISAYNVIPNSTVTQKEEAVNESGAEPFIVVEEMPMFPGGDAALLKFIGANTMYPEAAKENNIQGKVIIRFCVKPDGSVSLASILKGVSPELDAEALRVVNSLPAFNPGRQGGKAVPVWYMVPISFTLK
jgi:protein TonB